MKQQLEQRLQQLNAEYESGKQVLAELKTKQVNVQSTLLRIQGAIQVLEEELAKAEEESLFAPNGLDSEPIEVLTHAHD